MISYRADGPFVILTTNGRASDLERHAVFDAIRSDPQVPDGAHLILDLRKYEAKLTQAELDTRVTTLIQRPWRQSRHVLRRNRRRYVASNRAWNAVGLRQHELPRPIVLRRKERSRLAHSLGRGRKPIEAGDPDVRRRVSAHTR